MVHRDCDSTLPAWAQALTSPTNGRVTSTAYPKTHSLTLMKLAQTDPAQFVRRWRSAYRTRSRCALDNDELWAMTRVLARIADDILREVQIFSEAYLRSMDFLKGNTYPTWDSLVKFGLCSLCEEAVGASDFFDEYSYWVMDMVQVMDGLMSYSRYLFFPLRDRSVALYEATYQLAPKLWTAYWAHRHLLSDGNALERVVSGLAQHLRLHLRSMLCSYRLCTVDDPRPPRKEALHEPALHIMCWMRRDDPWPCRFEVQGSFAFLILMQPREIARFIENDIVQSLCAILGAHQAIFSNKAFSPHLVATGFLRALCGLLERQRTREYSEPGMISGIAEYVLDMMRFITEEVPHSDGAAILIREHNLFRLVARYILLQLSKTPTVHGQKCAISICSAYERMGQRLSARPGKNPLCKDLQHALRQEWAPLFIALDSLLPTLDPINGRPIITNVRKAWWRLGNIGAGLDEEKEKKEYHKRAEKMCSWVACDWHTVELPVATKLCKGCGEVRYCSAACQQLDWKSGHHKQRCRRLKDAPHHA
ncbi:unnamed protein product [Peniophora sp. CBMAI 1063]|nr:unnamed protein product [Peniophora sp. CBMAI 1063]